MSFCGRERVREEGGSAVVMECLAACISGEERYGWRYNVNGDSCGDCTERFCTVSISADEMMTRRPATPKTMLADRLAASPRCTRLFRIALSSLVAAEIADKYSTLESLFSDTGALPRSASLPEPTGQGALVWMVCVHAWNGSLAWVKFVTLVQLVVAAALAADVWPVTCSLICWWLHCSWCLRNASLVYILDRYLHLLLLYSAFFPTVPRATRAMAEQPEGVDAQ